MAKFDKYRATKSSTESHIRYIEHFCPLQFLEDKTHTCSKSKFVSYATHNTDLASQSANEYNAQTVWGTHTDRHRGDLSFRIITLSESNKVF